MAIIAHILSLSEAKAYSDQARMIVAVRILRVARVFRQSTTIHCMGT